MEENSTLNLMIAIQDAREAGFVHLAAAFETLLKQELLAAETPAHYGNR